MATRRPLVSIAGRRRQLPAGDTLAGTLPDAPSDGKQYGRKDGAWAEVVGGGGGTARIQELNKTADYTLAVDDAGAMVNCSGTWVLGITSAATLGAGWWCYVRNEGGGDITLDPAGSELIDGLTSYIMYPGEVRLVQCNGVALRTVVMNSFYKTFTESGVFTKPPGYTSFEGVLWGGGGSGAKYSTLNGGGGGAAVAFAFSQSIFASSETITIAASSTGPSVSGAGAQGNDSTLGALVVSYGGAGGSASTTRGGAGGGWLSAAQPNAVSGGAPSAGSNGGATFGGGTAAGAPNAGGGASIYGGGGGGTGTGAGGSSIYGGAGGGATGGISTHGGAGGVSMAGSSGGDGVAPGGGGGGTTSGAKAGNGARGELRIWGII